MSKEIEDTINKEITRRINDELPRFLTVNYKEPAPEDRALIELAMRIGSTITLETLLDLKFP